MRMYTYCVDRVAFPVGVLLLAHTAFFGDAFSIRTHDVSSTLKASAIDAEPSSRVLVSRISVDDFDPTQIVDHPLMITNALSLSDCEVCCDQLLADADSISVDLQEQQQTKDEDSAYYTTITKLYQCALAQGIGIIMQQSNSQTAYLTFCEGLLQETPALHDVQDQVTSARESVFSQTDWFPDFPVQARPADAVIVAGAGATSTLHRDPFEWTGTSICLEGTKVWRFIEPIDGVKAIDTQLDSYRLESIAWQEDGDKDKDDATSLSAGWQSDYSLYHSRQHESIPSASDFAELAETKKEEYEKLLEQLATDLDILKPNIPNAQDLVIHTAIQRPGDLLLIPAHWWHQTYGLEPSVAVASQRCGNLDAPLVFQHILDQVETTTARRLSTAASILDGVQSHEEAIARLFQEVKG